MPIVAATDLILYGAANRPEDDTAAGGGAISTVRRPVFTQLTANAVIALVSDGADTRVATVKFRNTASAIVTETPALNGAVEVLTAVTAERLIRVTLDAASGTRTVTIKQGAGGTTIATIPVNETEVYLVYADSVSESGISIRYDKLFSKNVHGTLTLTQATITLTADPEARIRIGLAASKNDSATIANRKTAPAAITFSDDSVVLSVPGNTLEAASAIGVWTEMNLPANDPPHRSTFTIRTQGATV